MKRFVVVAAVMAVLAVLAGGRSFFSAMAQPPQTVEPPLIGPPPAPPPPNSPVAPGVPASVSFARWSDGPPPAPGAITLAELIQQLKGIKQQKEEVAHMEAVTVKAIREKIEEEKKRIDEVEKYLENDAVPVQPCAPAWGAPHP